MIRFRVMLLAAFCLSASSGAAGKEPTALPRATVEELSKNASLPRKLVIRDATKIYWSFFISNYFGFDELWTSYSHDMKNWSKPLYTGIPILPSRNYKIRVTAGSIEADWFEPFDWDQGRRYFRSSIDTTVHGYTIYKHILYGDADADGLTDLAEEILWTDPNDMDTDGDGMADGYDANPLAAPAEEMTPSEQLHRLLIEGVLEDFPSHQLVIVEQPGDRALEYSRPYGLVLSLSPAACDAYVEANGYGVPILTCAVQPEGEQHYKVVFQFFVAPDDAWGYDAHFVYDEKDRSYHVVGAPDEWQVVPRGREEQSR